MLAKRTLIVAAAVLAVAAGLSARAEDWPLWGGSADRNMVCPSAKGMPVAFDAGETRAGKISRPGSKNVLWTAPLGTQTYGGPVIAGGRIFVGTNNGRPRDEKYKGDRGVMMCFNEADGKLLWQLVVPKLRNYGNFNGDLRNLGICATPTVDGDRVYVVTNRAAVLCLDVRGLANGNDGPFTDEAQCYAPPINEKTLEGPNGPKVLRDPGKPVKLGPTDADIIWRFDMMKEVSCWPQDASSCSMLVRGNYVYVGTSNAVDKSHKRLPYPHAPSFLILDKRTGRLVATDKSDIGTRVLHGQWSSPSLGVVNGREMIFYGAGDGFCYAYDPKPRDAGEGKVGEIEEIWRFDCNPPELRFRDGERIPYQTKHKPVGDVSPCEVIPTPVFHAGRIYVAIGQDTLHGTGPGCLSCFDPAAGTGDITKKGLVWRNTEVDRTLATVSVHEGLVYSADYTGILRCIDAGTGKTIWSHDVRDKIWNSTLVADGKVYIGTKRGVLHILAAGREKKVLGEVKLDTGICATPVVANGVFYIASMTRLYAVKCGG